MTGGGWREDRDRRQRKGETPRVPVEMSGYPALCLALPGHNPDFDLPWSRVALFSSPSLAHPWPQIGHAYGLTAWPWPGCQGGYNPGVGCGGARSRVSLLRMRRTPY